jgi:putative toxin-antitoxin system antitoxin component (TIGR02293 family)
VNPAAVLELLGGRKAFRGKVETTLDLVDLGEKGLTKASLLELSSFLELSTAQMARLLPITERTIQRYSRSTRLSRAVSDHLLEIARVAVRGVDVFEDKGRFLAWMRRPSVPLGNRKPMDLLASELGIDLVIDELGRIEHGLVS